MRITLRRLVRAPWYVVAASAIIALSAGSADATPVHWTFTGATFADGATASGSFDYDADTQSLLNFDVTTTAGNFIILDQYGSVSGGHHWLDPNGDNPPYPATGFAVEDLPLPLDMTDQEFLALNFAVPLSNLGGTVGLLTAGGEGFCTDSTCAFGDYQRHFSGGALVGTPVPEPSTVPLVAAGLTAMFLLRRRELLAKHDG